MKYLARARVAVLPLGFDELPGCDRHSGHCFSNPRCSVMPFSASRLNIRELELTIHKQNLQPKVIVGWRNQVKEGKYPSTTGRQSLKDMKLEKHWRASLEPMIVHLRRSVTS
jgi:hypothetical protein